MLQTYTPREAELLNLLERLVSWADTVGGWEAPVWADARAELERYQPNPFDGASEFLLG